MDFAQTRMLLLGNSFKKMKYSHNGRNLSCVPKDFLEIISGYNCSCAKPLTNKTCHKETPDGSIPTVLWSISIFILILLCLELLLIRCQQSFLNNFFGKLVFSMGIVSSLVTQFCTMQYLQEKSDDITVWYNVVLGVVSMAFAVCGFRFLFVRSVGDNIGSHDRGIGFVVFIVSFFLVGLEVTLIIMVYTAESISSVFASFLLVYALEKIVQSIVYIAIRRSKPREEFRKGTVFYLYFLSYVNFTLWFNSIPFTNFEIYDEFAHDKVLKYVDDTFKALLIDYRLLCALLFLEHGLAISADHANMNLHMQVDQQFRMPENRRFYAIVGFLIGLGCLGLQALNAAQFWHKNIHEAANICPILADAILVLLGCLLMRNVKVTVLHDKPVSLVLLMVTAMGAASVIYLFNFGLLSLISFKHDHPVSYVRWSACVYLFRGTSLLVLLLVYTGVPVSAMESSENHNVTNYLLISALCTGLFARFIGSILDEYDGVMHDMAHHHLKSNKLRSLRDLFVIGPLFQLAASLHLALHFFLMIGRLEERPKIKQVPPQEDVEPDNLQPTDDPGPRVAQENGGVAQGNSVATKPDGSTKTQNSSRWLVPEPDSALGSSSGHILEANSTEWPPADERTPLIQ